MHGIATKNQTCGPAQAGPCGEHELQRDDVGGRGVPVAKSAVAPPGPIPNPVVTRRSAGEYCGGDPVGGEAAAGPPIPLKARAIRRDHGPPTHQPTAGWSSGSSLGS
jgi:hypothetical protein